MGRTLGIIGPGLIGGSMAVDLRRRHFADSIIGVEKEAVNAAAALSLGIVDRIVDFDECVRSADILIVAVPVGTAVKMLPRILDIYAGEGPSCSRIVIDICSTKGGVVKAVAGHPMRGRYVATHPMAGTEYSGPWAAQPGLFDSRACIVADKAGSDPDAVQTIEGMYDTLNMRIIEMDASAHDVHTAYVSHISHITSFALALTVLDKEKDEKHIFDLASGGFSSTVRLAKSSADMWVPIMDENRDNILHVIDTYIDKMQLFREAIAGGNLEGIRSLIEESNKIKRILK